MAPAVKNTRQGAVMEGLFAMYCAAYLIDPNHGQSISEVKKFINSLAVDTELKELSKANSNSVTYNKTFPNELGKSSVFGTTVVTGAQAKQKLPGFRQKEISKYIRNNMSYFETIEEEGYPDFSVVQLKVILKEQETGFFYGNELKKLLEEEQKDSAVVGKYEEIKSRMDTMIRAKSAIWFGKLIRAKQRFIMNNQSDVVHWRVDAAGIIGEGTGGAIKEDIIIKVWANGKKIHDETIKVSLKADSYTIHSGGIYDGIDKVYEMFGGLLPKKEYQNAIGLLTEIKKKKNFTHNGNIITAREGINIVWRMMIDHIPKVTDTPDFKDNDTWWSILERNIFGTGSGRHFVVVDIRLKPAEVSEIPKEYFMYLKNSGVQMYPIFVEGQRGADTPGNVFLMPKYPDGTIEKNKDKSMYKFSVLYLKPKEVINGETVKAEIGVPNKLMVNVGGKKSIIHADSYDEYAKHFKDVNAQYEIL